MQPRVAIVIPIYGHSALASEAIASALALQGGTGAVVVAVDDGCPNAETRAVLEGWARRAPGRFHRLHQANRGLSGARNSGIGFALARYPSVEAVFLLDADNRLDPHSLILFDRLLADEPEADWFYPNFDMFGLESHAHNGGPFSLAQLSVSNQCEAGSLVRRRVFEAGVWFDESMRQGYEDWDFWLGAAKAGFRGSPVRQAFFRYRKRPESMLSGSHGLDAKLRTQIREKHRWLYDKDRVARHAAAQMPPYLLIEPGAQGADVWRFDAPGDLRRSTLQDEMRDWLAAHARPGMAGAPAVWLFARPGLMRWLDERKLAGSVVWHLHSALRDADIAVGRVLHHPGGQRQLTVTPPMDPPGTKAREMPGKPARKKVLRVENRAYRMDRLRQQAVIDEADIVAVSATGLMHQLCYPRARRAAAQARERERLYRLARVADLRATLEDRPDLPGWAPRETLMRVERQLRRHEGRQYYPLLKPWRDSAKVAGPMDLDWVARGQTLDGVPLMTPAGDGGPDIGFVLPIFQFGGVEKCVVALARALRDRGARCHLFVYGNSDMAATDWLTEPFAAIHQLTDPDLRNWRGPQYLGTNTATEPSPALLRDMLAPLCGMDAVIATGTAALFHGLSQLRGKGIVTASWEHLVETGGYGRIYGTPYLGVAYEGGLDLILTCSNRLAQWMHGQGAPRAKLLPIPNGPGFPMPPEAVQAALAARAERAADAPLRVGFLGRFDGQKGADRFLEIARRCRGLPIEFSITGGAVLGADGLEVPDRIARHPAAFSREELAEAFARIDVLLMPSRGEGLPLTIFEAQREGVIPVATDVGAVSEAIEDGVDGFLVSGGDVVDRMTALLHRLVAEPDLRAGLSMRAAGNTGRWEANADTLLEALEAKIKRE